MTEEKQDILEDFYSGDKKDIKFTIKDGQGTLVPLDNAEITYALFSDNGKSQTILFQKSSEDITQIEVVGLGLAMVYLLPGDTINLDGTYRHHLHVQDSNGYGEIVSTGKVNIFKSFARRPRSSSKPAYLSGTIT